MLHRRYAVRCWAACAKYILRTQIRFSQSVLRTSIGPIGRILWDRQLGATKHLRRAPDGMAPIQHRWTNQNKRDPTVSGNPMKPESVCTRHRDQPPVEYVRHELPVVGVLQLFNHGTNLGLRQCYRTLSQSSRAFPFPWTFCLCALAECHRCAGNAREQ